MNVFVTGGTGFIGGQLIDSLTTSGWEITALVRKGRTASLEKFEGLRILEGDLTGDIPGLEKTLETCEIVFHSAAVRDRWGISKETYARTNIEGTRRLLEVSRGRVSRFVYVSSVGVMGEHNRLGVDETFTTSTYKGKVGYHSTKAAAEKLVQEFANAMEVCIVRPTITYGQGDKDGMLTRLIIMISKGQFFRVGRGLNQIHLTYIDDLVQGLRMAAVHPQANGQVYNIAGPEPIEAGELIKLIELKLGRKPRRFFIPETLARLAGLGFEGFFLLGNQLKMIKNRQPPITRDKIDTLCNHQGYSYDKAERMLGYSPSIGINEGVEKTISWMVNNGLLELPEGLTAGLPSHTKTPG
jgi:nucleoside-diphosphate-sugar epimerase